MLPLDGSCASRSVPLQRPRVPLESPFSAPVAVGSPPLVMFSWRLQSHPSTIVPLRGSSLVVLCRLGVLTSAAQYPSGSLPFSGSLFLGSTPSVALYPSGFPLQWLLGVYSFSIPRGLLLQRPCAAQGSPPSWPPVSQSSPLPSPVYH